MKIVAINGRSRVGKSTVVRELLKDDRFHLIKSATTRKQRDETDLDHTFVSKDEMEFLKKIYQTVAENTIGGEDYASFKHQFHEDKINLYIIDDTGLRMLRNTNADIVSVRLYRDVEKSPRDKVFLDDGEFNVVLQNKRVVKTANEILNFLKERGWL